MALFNINICQKGPSLLYTLKNLNFKLAALVDFTVHLRKKIGILPDKIMVIYKIAD